MVHALKLVHHLLKPGGNLVDMHDLPVPHMIEIHAAEAVIKAGWLEDRSAYVDERSALNALIQVVDEGDFQLEDERDFNFEIHAADLPELQAYLASWWESVFIPDATLRRVGSILRQVPAKSKVVLALPTRMVKLSKV